MNIVFLVIKFYQNKHNKRKKMSKEKKKGTGFETWLTKKLNENNIRAERTPLSGAIGGKYNEDVVLGTRDNILAKIECKNRESITKTLWDWLDENDFLALKKNYKKPLIVMDLDQFIKIAKHYYK